jgi:hypothetical protein
MRKTAKSCMPRVSILLRPILQHLQSQVYPQHFVTFAPTNSLGMLSSALQASGCSAVPAASGHPWLQMM